MSTNYLVVPMQLDALVVNQGVLDRDGFRRWQYDYTALQHYKSPEPEAFQNMNDSAARGVYLHWTLPRALRSGVQDQVTGQVTYPLVPNRWLIVRVWSTDAYSDNASRQVTGWVLESDCPQTSKSESSTVAKAQTSQYLVDPVTVQAWLNSTDPYRNTVALDPKSTEPQVANLGIPFPLSDSSDGWEERAADPMFLTAIAPGNELFSDYYAHNAGVFSFCDSLTGIDSAKLSYLVVGWYSNPQKDLLATVPAASYTDFLRGLRWTMTDNDETQATASLYQGMAFGLTWDAESPVPPQPDPMQALHQKDNLKVAIGNTTIDAFSALVAQQLQATGHDAHTVKLLRAFQYDLLPMLNQVNGDALLEGQIRQAWYNAKTGVTRWMIVRANGVDDAANALTAQEAAWLLQLNQDQAALEKDLQQLFDRQARLYEYWLKYNFLKDTANPQPHDAPNIAQLAQQLDPDQTGSLAEQVLSQIKTVQALLARVPRPDYKNTKNAEQALQNGIQAFAQQKGLSLDKQLKAVTGARFWQANNPVIVLSGVNPSSATDPKESLNVRLMTRVITGIKGDSIFINADTAADVLPILKWRLPASLPTPMLALMHEFFFLDIDNAMSLYKADPYLTYYELYSSMVEHQALIYLGTLPDLNLNKWQQSWNPAYCEWSVNYTYLPDSANGEPNWTFDGTDYHYTGQAGANLESRTFGGLAVLNPSAQFVFGSRLKKFLETHGSDQDLQNLSDWIAQIDDWQFLALELTGFNELLALRDRRAFRRPSPQEMVGTGGQNQYALASLLGFGGATTGLDYALPDPYTGQVSSAPYFPDNGTPDFHGLRRGQFYFENLIIYDQFGRKHTVIESGQPGGSSNATSFPLIRDTALVPKHPVNSNIAAPVQLPPRVLQHAQLNFQFVDGHDPQKTLGFNADVNPICGWVLPNHLDHSLLLYAPDGTSLGEFSLFENAQGVKAGRWQPPPHSAGTSALLTSLDVVARYSPCLKQLLSSKQLQTQSGFEAFLSAIDATLWTVDPLGNRQDQNLSVLIGRPLALVRARLQLQLNGPALTDTSWAATLNPPPADFLSNKFAIRIGDQATRADGVIGYYTGDDYDIFNSVVAPGTTTSQSYVKQIGPPNGGTNYLELQFDPSSQALVCLLVDPRASIHATSGILPVKEIQIPSGFVDTALDNLEVSFHSGPLLTWLRAMPAQDGHTPPFAQAISVPMPAEQNGAWSWWEPDVDSGNWNGYGLLNAVPNAQFQSPAQTLREGVLQLVLDLENKS